MVKLHIFDMDHTLISVDCDVTWKEFLVAEKLAPASDLQIADKFFADYNAGCMDNDAFLRFQLREFSGKSAAEMAEISQRHFEKMIRSQIRQKAVDFVRTCRKSGDICVILSATNSVLVAPVAEFFGISEYYGTVLEMRDGCFTGEVAPDGYFAGSGKARMLQYICCKHAIAPENTAAYGDSINDAPILQACGHPHAVSPSPALKELAEKNKWRILEWRA